jgi:hypothetical protein
MDSQTSPNRSELLNHLQQLMKASVGGMVVASATVAAPPVQAANSLAATGNNTAITQRVQEVRKQIKTATLDAEKSESGPLLAWGNWHNWRNGWGNGWHNWGNWHN